MLTATRIRRHGLRPAALTCLLPLVVALAACTQADAPADNATAATTAEARSAPADPSVDAAAMTSADASMQDDVMAAENQAAGDRADDPAAGAATQADTGDADDEPAGTSDTATAVFAGGCFWCMEPPYDMLAGVTSTISGYSGGNVADPSYEQVSAGGTGHIEVVQIAYDARQVDYEKLLEVFWRNIDPFAVDRQFCDAGPQYRSAIFVANARERELAEASKQRLEARFDEPITTEILDAATFYPAEDYHQDYYTKNPVRYKFYRWNCGRDQRLEEVWGEQAG